MVCLSWLTACSGLVQPSIEPTGELFFIALADGEQYLRRYDVAAAEQETLFTVPDGGWLAQTAVSPDGSQIALAYSPPQIANSNLYLMLADGQTEPRPLTQLTQPNEIYFQPTWGENGRYLYYAHNIPLPNDSLKVRTYVERWDIITGKQEPLVADAFWPRLSDDGQQLAYVRLNPDTLARSLYVATATGEQPRELIGEMAFADVDAPLFSADGEWLYFSAVEATAARRAWWEVVLGVQVAQAHDVPSDWWRVPVAGGEPERVTAIEGVGMYGVFNGRLLAFSSTNGLYLLPPNAAEPTLLLETVATNSLSWIER